MRICDTYGAGFFFIPGTDTCLRIGGFVRVEGLLAERVNAGTNVYSTHTRFVLNLDARSNTEYGLLRAFGEYTIRRGSATNTLPFVITGTGTGVTAQATSAHLTRSFIQFAGFTAGHTASFFNFYQDDLRLGFAGGAGGPSGTASTVFAYTASFGSGFSATVSIEDPQFRRVGSQTIFVPGDPGGILGGGVAGSFNAPAQVNGVIYNGQALPEIVGNLRVDQGWGSAQVMAAFREVRTGLGAASTSKSGFAVGAGVRLNLDMLARGSVVWLQGVYTDGALNYAFTNINSDGIPASRQTFTVKAVSANYADGVLGAAGGIQTSKAWAIHGGIRHFWTPAVRSSLFASYVSVDAPTGALAIANNLRDFNTWFVGANTIWSPVRNLDLGIEVMYQSISRRASTNAFAGGALTPANTNASAGAWSANFRVQRNF